jgi:hypothetical protein
MLIYALLLLLSNVYAILSVNNLQNSNYSVKTINKMLYINS